MNDKEFMVEKIRSAYTEPQHTELDALKALDAKVKRPAKVFGFTWGTVGAIVMGSGMSLVMTGIGSVLGMEQPLVPGIVIGAAGLVMTLTTWPIYKRILTSRKKKFAPEIMELSDRITRGGEANV